MSRKRMKSAKIVQTTCNRDNPMHKRKIKRNDRLKKVKNALAIIALIGGGVYFLRMPEPYNVIGAIAILLVCCVLAMDDR